MTTLSPRDALEVVRSAEFSAHGYCNVCDGWMASPNGSTRRAHAKNCKWVKAMATLTNLVERAGEPVAWMPIETAPKDRPVIVSNGEAVGEASYHESDNGWWWAGYHPTDAADGYVWQPTHWQPLPAAPGASHER